MSVHSHPVIRGRRAHSPRTAVFFAALLALGIQAEELPPLGGGFQHVPVVGVDADGDFVVVWESTGSSGTDTSPSSIQGQLFSVAILSDGFESGDTSAWSATVP